MLVLRRLWVLVACVGLFFAPEEARAVDECGALNSGNSFIGTCSSATYGMGIAYSNVAGAPTLTVSGGAATTVTVTAPSSRSWPVYGAIGVTAASGTGSRAIALTVGSGSDRVVISRHASSVNTDANQGVVALQLGTGADATMVRLGSGVTIGTMAAPMQGRGVWLLQHQGAAPYNSGTQTLISAATIHSSGDGLVLDNRGSGNSVLTNSGAITVTATSANKAAIRIENTGAAYGPGRLATTETMVTNTGNIESIGATNSGRGIWVDVEGLGSYKIVHSGAITAGYAGIEVKAEEHKGAAGITAVEIESSGSITTRGDGGGGIYVFENLQAPSHAASLERQGDIEITTTGGTITTAGAGAHGIYLQNRRASTVSATTAAAGDATIENAATIMAPGAGAEGIRLLQQAAAIAVAAGTTTYGTNAGAGTIVNTGDITAGSNGIYLQNAGTGDVSVTNSGAIVATNGRGIRVEKQGERATAGDVSITTTGGSITANGARREGISVLDHADHSGAVTIANAGGIEANGYGIFVARLGTGAVSVTHTAGTVSSTIQAGISAANATGDASTVTVAVGSTASTAAAVTSEGQSRPAVELLQRGTGDATVTVHAGASLTSKHNAGIYADLTSADNAAGQVEITQGGAILARKGVYARIARSATAETVVARAASAQPALDVTWTGTFSHGTTATVAGNDDDRFLARHVRHAVLIAQEVETEKAMRPTPDGDNTGHLRYGSPAGIEAQVMSWREVMTAVSEGDDPGEFADADAVTGTGTTALFGANADAATQARAAAVIAAFRAALGNADLDTVPGAAAIDTDGTTGLSDDEIETYLSVDSDERRRDLREVLSRSLSDAEKAVLRAVATNDAAGLTAALDAEGAGFSAGYKTAVRALLNRYNTGNINVAVDGGSIVATRGDGIRAYYATPNANNGAISVSVAAGTTVSGGMAGIYVANAGMTGEDAMRIRKQTVTVNGMVTGGSDAAVHLVGGGTLTVGAMGKVHAGSSGVAILVNEPGRSDITINGEVRGGAGGSAAVRTSGGGTITIGRTGMVIAAGATNAIQADEGDTAVTLRMEVDNLQTPYRDEATTATARLQGNIVGVKDDEVVLLLVDDQGRTGMATTVSIGNDNRLTADDISFPPRPDDGGGTGGMLCRDASDRACALYEALPSALLGVNGLPTYAERASAARGAAGGWARVDAASGKWKASRASQGPANVAYDRSRAALRAGVDMALGEDGRLGLSAHGVTGSAKMTQNGGKVAVTGVGMGLTGTALAADGIYVDGQLAVTRYDVDLTNDAGTKLKDGAKGTGYALALETGRTMAMDGGMRLTPRAGLSWSRVTLRGFTDARDRPVSMKGAGGLTASVGVAVESAPSGGSRLFGSLDVTHDLANETKTTLATTTELTARANRTGLRVGVGGAVDLGDGAALLGSVDYTAAGGGTSAFGGGVSLAVQF